MTNNFLCIRKVGLFYNTFDEDAEILNYLLNYKIINGRCGFPINGYNKVINTLEDFKINFKVIDVEKKIKDFKDLNKYDYYLAKSKKKIALDAIINKILTKIEKMDEESLYKILKYIEDLVNV